ncbi:MAG: hypothetical protein KDI28_03360 [Pseudomonadales bacterium]|nr:hypothetical protein [Pseudomonadales bacterium]
MMLLSFRFRPWLAALLLGCSANLWAQTGAPADNGEDAYFRNAPDAQKYVLIITGAAASDEIRNRFRQWSFSLQDILSRDYGYDRDSITLLFDDGAQADSASFRIDGSSRREDIEAHLAQLARELAPGDQLSIIMIGHGSSSEDSAKFNIVGPDITGEEFAQLLEPFSQQDVVIVNTTSASYEFAADLSARGRVVLSATRSRAERYDPMFGGYFVEALDSHRGDRDKNNRVSVLEAYLYASQSVLGWYSDQGRLPTERAVLDDNGDGVFSLEPGPGMSDGALAEIAYFDIPSAAEAKTSTEAIALHAQMQDLERSIFLLRGQKANYLEEDYWSRMETLLIDLARKTGRYNELP